MTRAFPGQLRWALALFFFIALQILLTSRLRNLDVAWVSPPSDKREKWDSRLFEVLTFGHLPSVTDWLWVQAILDPYETAPEKGTRSKLYYDLELLSDLDPLFFEVYVAGSHMLTILRNDAVGGRNLLVKGNHFRKAGLPSYSESFREKYWSRAWDIPVTLGYVYLFELGDMPEAAVAFREASETPGVPAYVQSLANRLEKPGGEYEVGLRLLAFLLTAPQSEESRRVLQRKRDSLLVAKYVYDANQEFREFLRRQVDYRSGKALSADRMNGLFRDFLRSTGSSATDPWGGTLSLDTKGWIATSTPRDRVFNLD